MTKISDKQFDQLRCELDACTGAAVSFNAYRDEHDYLVLSVKQPVGGSEALGIGFHYCTYIAGPTRWDNAKLLVSMENLGSGETVFVVQDAEADFSVKCHGPINFAGDSKRVYPRT